MKTSIVFLHLLIIISINFLTVNVSSQPICRGHGNNDLYFSGETNYYDFSVFRSTDNGTTSSIVNTANWLSDTLITDCILKKPIACKEEGFLYFFNSNRTVAPYLFSSNDFGLTYTPMFNCPATPVLIAGGEESGELYIQTRGQDTALYYSNDSGQTFTLTHLANFYWIEVGTEPHEIWALSGNATTYWFLYSNTNGISFDTIPIDQSIIGSEASFYQ